MRVSKIFAIFTVLLILFSVTVLASENYEINYENQYQFNYDIHNNGTILENDNLYNYLLEQSKLHNETINVLDYQISEASAKAVITKFFLNEEVYYISSVKALAYENGYLKEIQVTYTFSQEEISNYDEQLNNVLQKYLAGIDENWLDIEKILYTDIFVCKNVEYGSENNYSSHTIQGALINKSASSDGYAKTFKYLLRNANIDSTLVTSNYNNSSWNMVELDGIYYHIDCFKNDISGYGKTSYEYMFKSDEYMSSEVTEWTAEHKSVPEMEYDEDWLYADTYLNYENGYWYYLYNNFEVIEIDRYNFVDSQEEYGTPIDGILEESLIWSPGFAFDGTNYYISANKDIYILDYNFDTGEATFEKYFSITEEDKTIYSIECVNGAMYYDTTIIDSNGFTTEDSKTSNVYAKLISISSDETDVTIEQGQIYNLKLIKNPEEGTGEITWESLDSNIVTVFEGTIQGINIGTTKVIATFEDFQVTYNITVKEPEIIVPEEPTEITTLNTETVGEYEIIIFDAKTTINSIINSTNFPVLEDSQYSITILGMTDELKENWDEYIGSRNTIVVSKSGEEQAQYKAIVKGDVTGDGILRMYDAFQILKDVIVGKTFDDLDCIIRDHSSSGDRIVRMYDAFQYLKEAIIG